MTTVTAVIAIKKQAVPAATQTSQVLRCRLMQGATQIQTANASLSLSPPTISFAGVADGAYTLNVQRLDVNSLPIGDALNQDITVTAPPIEIDVPASMTVTFS